MLGELFLLTFILFFILQSSNLWSSLTLIPTTVLLIWCFSDLMNLSNIILSLMLLLIFVGGLLILIVSVAILSLQDQGTSWMIQISISCIICSLSLMSWVLDESVFKMNVFALLWLSCDKWVLLLMILLILSSSLLVISIFLLKSVNFLRSV